MAKFIKLTIGPNKIVTHVNITHISRIIEDGEKMWIAIMDDPERWSEVEESKDQLLALINS